MQESFQHHLKKGAGRDIITGLSMDVILAMERGNVEHLPKGVLKRGDVSVALLLN